MKIKTLFFLFFISLSSLTAQDHFIKARIFGFPGGFSFLSIGLGYERIVSSNSSVQLLYNRFSWDMRDTDGDGRITHLLVPEYRFYFNQETPTPESWFTGIFTELAWSKKLLGGYESDISEGMLIKNRRISLNPGILIGKNIPLSKRFHVDTYLGIKYNFHKEKSTYLQNSIESIEIENQKKLGVRVGVNLNYKF